MKNHMLSTVLITAALTLAAALPARAQQDEMMMHHAMTPRSVTVSGEGAAEAMPDQATVRFGVVTLADDPEVAREQNAEASAGAMNAVRELGIPEEDLQLETLRLQPRYDYDDGERELLGYEAERRVRVEVDDLELVPTLVAEVVQQGANRLQGISYGLEDRAQTRNEALREAAQEARAKAEVLAQALDAEVSQVLQINEQGYEPPRPVMYQAMARAESADAAPEPDAFAPGRIEVEARVQVTFALE